MTRTIFTKSYLVPNYEGGRPTILKRQISQKIFTSEFMLPDSKIFFDALLMLLAKFEFDGRFHFVKNKEFSKK